MFYVDGDLIKIVVSVITALSAGAFFGYKVASGFFNQNLSLSVDASRYHSSDEADRMDLVHCKIAIEKGTIAALALEGLEARFVWGQEENETKQIQIEVCRLKIKPSSDLTQPRVTWARDVERPHLYLSPGEKTSFECIALVPRNAVCKVDVVAFGRRRVAATSSPKWWAGNTFQAQWRASAVVLGLQT